MKQFNLFNSKIFFLHLRVISFLFFFSLQVNGVHVENGVRRLTRKGQRVTQRDEAFSIPPSYSVVLVSEAAQLILDFVQITLEMEFNRILNGEKIFFCNTTKRQLGHVFSLGGFGIKRRVYKLNEF